MFEKIDIRKIVRNHNGTIYNYNTKKVDRYDIILFYVLPVIFGVSLTYFGIRISRDAASLLISTLSILVGLFFNVIVIIFDIVKRDGKTMRVVTLLKELIANISYSILLAILIVGLSALSLINYELIKLVSALIVFVLSAHYGVIVLMILKRTYKLFDNEINTLNTKAEDSNKL